jgi:large subunit ribosomal protein L29
MKRFDIKELTTKELEEKIVDEKNLLIRQKLNHAVSPLDNPHKIRKTKKEIARLLTELQIRKLNNNPKS